MSSARPTTGMRVGTAARRLGTASARRVGTARLGTARMSTAARLGTARARGGPGGGEALNTQISLGQRPMTQQGLGGLKTAAGGRGRIVMDETFFLGELRGRITALTTEINLLNQEYDRLEKDHGSYLSYEKKAERLAAEIKDLHGQLADLNMANDSLNTNVDVRELREESSEIKERNERESQEVDAIFERRVEIDNTIKKIDQEIEAERRKADDLVQDMDESQKQQYQMLKQQNNEMMTVIEDKQGKLDTLDSEVNRLQREIKAHPLKQQAVGLYDQIAALETKNKQLEQQIARDKETSPEELKKRLLEQVKADNQEIAALERKIAEIEQEIDDLEHGDVSDDEDDTSEQSEEKRKKYQQLLDKEKEINDFLVSFGDNMDKARRTLESSEQDIVDHLEAIGRALARSNQLPSKEEHESLQADLDFKSAELERSKQTSENLQSKREQLAKHLRNVTQLETNIDKELDSLKESMATKKEELAKFRDISGLAKQMEQTKENLADEKQRLAVRSDVTAKIVSDMQQRRDKIKSGLESDETYLQLSALEKKLQHFHKNNFVVSEYIESREHETNYEGIAKDVRQQVKDINKRLQKELANRPKQMKSTSM